MKPNGLKQDSDGNLYMGDPRSAYRTVPIDRTRETYKFKLLHDWSVDDKGVSTVIPCNQPNCLVCKEYAPDAESDRSPA